VVVVVVVSLGLHPVAHNLLDYPAAQAEEELDLRRIVRQVQPHKVLQVDLLVMDFRVEHPTDRWASPAVVVAQEKQVILMVTALVAMDVSTHNSTAVVVQQVGLVEVVVPVDKQILL
jgi:hypothetical protein